MSKGIPTYTKAGVYRRMIKAGIYIYLEKYPEAMTWIKENPAQFDKLIFIANDEQEPVLKLDIIADKAKEIALVVKYKAKEYAKATERKVIQ